MMNGRSGAGSSMRYVAPILMLSLLVLASPVAADDVYMKNGRVFEDVIADVGESTIKIYMAFGEMSFSLDAVERVERGESSLVAYQQRHDDLVAAAGASAADWVELARWAQEHGLDHNAREAALRAATMDPHAEGIDRLMRSFDLVYEPRLGRWVPLAESMGVRGYKQVAGQWLSPEQQLARSQALAERERARAAEEERRLTRAVLTMAAAQLAREREPEVVYTAYPAGVWVNPFVWGPDRPNRPHHPIRPQPRHSQRGSDSMAIPLHNRQPGSLFPIQHNRGGVGGGSSSASTGTVSGSSQGSN